MGGPSILPEARKTGIPDGKSRPKELEKLRKNELKQFETHLKRFKTL